MQLQPGDLYKAIDVNGDEAGLVIFLAKIPPHSLSRSETSFYMFWNLKVLMHGEIRYLDTSSWSLLPA